MFLRIVSFSFLLNLVTISYSHAYSVPVHEEMSGISYDQSVLSSSNGNYLVQLGLTNDQKFNGQKARDLVKTGSKFEDDGARALNHFYDPTTGQGLLNLPNFSATDAVNWGLKLQPCGLNCGTITQTWSIPDARNYFYKALTDSDATIRETDWANTFQALGHVIHLIQDMAQPQHVRNETHPETDIPFLSFLNFDRSRYEEYTKSDKKINLLSYSGYSAVNLSDYISYWTTGYGSAWASGRSGLADVTNENFFSERAAFDCNGDLCSQEGHYLPVINLTTVGPPETVDVSPNNDGTIVGQMQFFSHTFIDPVTGQSVTNPRALAQSFFDLDLRNQGSTKLILSPNRLTFEESQKILVKRAVGYSAGLLNHFFRGQLEVNPVLGGIRVKNINMETMNSFYDSNTGTTIGKIEVYYDNTAGRQLLTGVNLSSPLAPGGTIDISFSLPTDNIKPGRYVVVFRGKLGAEEGAVIGKVYQNYIYYVATASNGLKQIFRMDPDGTNVTLVYDNLATPLDIGRLSVSPDGKKLAFGAGTSTFTSKIYLFDLASAPQTTATLLTAGDAPAWSPDGTKIAFERESGLYLPVLADIEIYTVDPSNGTEVRLTDVPGSSASQDASWSPDGTKIAYTRFNGGQEPNCANFYVITLMTSSGELLGSVSCDSNVAYSDSSPSWSPDGQALVFTRRDPNPAQNAEQLFNVDLTTPPTVTKLTDSNGIGFRELWPVWGLDGTRIAVGSSRDGDADIWLVAPAGGYLTNLTNGNPGSDQFPAFGR